MAVNAIQGNIGKAQALAPKVTSKSIVTGPKVDAVATTLIKKGVDPSKAQMIAQKYIAANPTAATNSTTLDPSLTAIAQSEGVDSAILSGMFSGGPANGITLGVMPSGAKVATDIEAGPALPGPTSTPDGITEIAQKYVSSATYKSSTGSSSTSGSAYDIINSMNAVLLLILNRTNDGKDFEQMAALKAAMSRLEQQIQKTQIAVKESQITQEKAKAMTALFQSIPTAMATICKAQDTAKAAQILGSGDSKQEQKALKALESTKATGEGDEKIGAFPEGRTLLTETEISALKPETAQTEYRQALGRYKQALGTVGYLQELKKEKSALEQSGGKEGTAIANLSTEIKSTRDTLKKDINAALKDPGVKHELLRSYALQPGILDGEPQIAAMLLPPKEVTSKQYKSALKKELTAAVNADPQDKAKLNALLELANTNPLLHSFISKDGDLTKLLGDKINPSPPSGKAPTLSAAAHQERVELSLKARTEPLDFSNPEVASMVEQDIKQSLKTLNAPDETGPDKLAIQIQNKEAAKHHIEGLLYATQGTPLGDKLASQDQLRKYQPIQPGVGSTSAQITEHNTDWAKKGASASAWISGKMSLADSPITMMETVKHYVDMVSGPLSDAVDGVNAANRRLGAQMAAANKIKQGQGNVDAQKRKIAAMFSRIQNMLVRASK